MHGTESPKEGQLRSALKSVYGPRKGHARGVSFCLPLSCAKENNQYAHRSISVFKPPISGSSDKPTGSSATERSQCVHTDRRSLTVPDKLTVSSSGAPTARLHFTKPTVAKKTETVKPRTSFIGQATVFARPETPPRVVAPDSHGPNVQKVVITTQKDDNLEDLQDLAVKQNKGINVFLKSQIKQVDRILQDSLKVDHDPPVEQTHD